MTETKTDAPAADAPPEIKTTPVQALKWHTYRGGTYEAGDQYECAELDVMTVEAQGMALRVELLPAEPREGKGPGRPHRPGQPVDPTYGQGHPIAHPKAGE
jgi:hypothetical protein